MELKIEDFDKLVSYISKRFAHKNTKNVADEEDYYQESWLIILEIMNKDTIINEKGSKQYFTNSIINGLSRQAAKWNSPLNITPEAAKLCQRIYVLEQEGESIPDIIDALQISEKRFYELKNILTRDQINQEPSYEGDPTDLFIFSELREFLSEDEKILLNMCLNNDSIATISLKLKKSKEHVRMKIKKLFERIRSKYEY